MANSVPVITMYDEPMWASIGRQRLELQKCRHCGQFRYPPGPLCPHCLSEEYDWTPISGRAAILSWVVFHKQYFDDYKPPYNAVTVQLEEGPVIVTNLIGATPEGSWVGKKVEFCYEDHLGKTIHRVRLAG